jgi:hypothetical protein
MSIPKKPSEPETPSPIADALDLLFEKLLAQLVQLSDFSR